MDVAQAFEVLGLEIDATTEEVERTYRQIRKPLLKQLNRHDEGEAPEGLVKLLDNVETAFRVITATPRTPVPTQPGGRARSKSTGRVTGLQPGVVIGDRYEVRAHVSHRPEGDTYRVTDRVRGVDVALKVVDAGLMRDPRIRTRFVKGLLAASRMNHPNLARVLDIVRLQHTLVVIQELPNGDNLWDLMYGPEALRERLTQDLVLGITEQAAHALAYLHGEMAHGTLRPESIWVDDDGRVQISDFGLAGLQAPLRERRLSRAKLGTVYWAPEQYRDDIRVSPRSDQYALSLILYEILSGKPSVGRTVGIRTFRRDYPKRFTAAIERGLSSKAPQRFGDMDAFGQAALSTYETEQPEVSSVAIGSIILPALVLFGLFIGFVASPLGTQASDAISDVVRRWHVAEEDEKRAHLDLRRLRDIGNRLDKRRASLSQVSQDELRRLRSVVARNDLDAERRATARHDLTQIVKQLVDTSRRRSHEAFERTTAALDAFQELGEAVARTDETGDAATDLSSATLEERNEKVIELVYRQAGAARRKALWREQRRELFAQPSFAKAYRALLEADAALEIGDETTTGQAYDVAAVELTAVAESVEAAVEAVMSFDPFEAAPGAATRLDAVDCRKCLEAWLGDPTTWTDDEALARMLKDLWAEGVDDAEARALVSKAGYWVLEMSVGATVLGVGGTWDDDTGARRLHVTVVNGVALAERIGVPAQHGDQRPGLRDLLAALAAVPRDARALWTRRSSSLTPLPKPAFDETHETLQSGTLDVRGALATSASACCVLVDKRRVEPADERFEIPVRVPGDVLSTWIRAHAARGLRSGPATWMRVRTDGLKPRVAPLYPAPGHPVDAGSTVEVRLLVYDSNLQTTEIAGRQHTLRKGEVHVILHTVTAPDQDELEIPVRAVDAAGNERVVTFTWPVK